jgi:hypothetical protein
MELRKESKGKGKTIKPQQLFKIFTACDNQEL